MNIYKNPKCVKFAVAPMLDWTDRHCRYFYRLMSKKALLYTEMVVADAAIHGIRERLLGFNDEEHPLALQLGGSDPIKLAEAAKIGSDYGYDEINLNVGCPSDRVQSGTFGACLMQEPERVARAVLAMKEAVNIPVTVKCRIGVDEQDVETALDDLSNKIWDAGCDALYVHARKAWLKGLSPKENRNIPPLNYQRVYKLKENNTNKFIGINGGIKTIDEMTEHLTHVDAVMVGRQIYHNPEILLQVDEHIYGEKPNPLDEISLIEAMCAYAQKYCADGGRLSHITRHMIGMFHGRGNAKIWRQILSNEANQYDAKADIIKYAYSFIE